MSYMAYCLYVTGPAIIDYLSAKNYNFLSLLCHNLINIFTSVTKSYGLSSATYRNGILDCEQRY